MKNKALFYLTGFLASISIIGYADAEPGWMELGVRGGISSSTRKVDFEQYEVFISHHLTPQWELDSGWIIRTQVSATLGELRSDENSGVVATLGPGLTFTRPDARFSIDIGSSPTYISEPVHGAKDLGGNIHFISHVRLNYSFSNRFAAGYRFQHMSNAGLEDDNPGLNMQTLELSYRF